MQPRVLVVTLDVVGPKMAGPGIRAWELSHILGQFFPTTLAAPRPVPDNPPGFTCVGLPVGPGAEEALLALVDDYDVIVAQVLPPSLMHDEVLHDKYLVVDLYCPWLFENLERYRDGDGADNAWITGDVEAIARMIAHGDFFICAGERQRAYWLGALASMGRLTQAVYARDADGRALIDVVPFGLSTEPPHKTKNVLKGVLPGIGEHDFVALWGGGMWDWLDPLTLIHATARLRDAGYPIRTFFLGAQRPSVSAEVEVRPSMVEAARALSDVLGLTGTHVFFNDRWVPYAERANYLCEADFGISLHRNTLETRFAFRTRVLDYFWAGIVPIVNDGDTIADLLREHDVGRIVPIGDAPALARTIADLIDAPEERARLIAAGQTLAPSLTWQEATRPLVAFCRRPQKGTSVPETRFTQPPHLQRTLTQLHHTLGELNQMGFTLQDMRRMLAETGEYALRLEQEVRARDGVIDEMRAHITQLEHAVQSRSIARAIRAWLPQKPRA
jgi:glycosyltransferase involved in cell wall biosynthesis